MQHKVQVTFYSRLKLTSRTMFRPTHSALCLVICCLVCAESQEIIDLTHELRSDSVVWPGNPPFKFNIIHREQIDTHWYESNNFSTAEHGGTHLDSPSHFSKGKWRVHDIPLRNVIGPGVVIDITERARNNPDAQVEIDDLLKWEETNGKIPDKGIVVMNSGWSVNWPNASLIFGSMNVSDSSTFHFPGFSPVAAKWIVDNRHYINAVGVDTPSVDYGQSRRMDTHVIISNANIICLENIANLEKLPISGSTIFAIPLKLHDGSGSPSRIFAMTQFPLVCTAPNFSYYIIMFVIPFAVLYYVY